MQPGEKEPLGPTGLRTKQVKQVIHIILLKREFIALWRVKVAQRTERVEKGKKRGELENNKMRKTTSGEIESFGV